MTAYYIGFWMVIGGLVGMAIGNARHQHLGKSFFVGALLGIIGWLLLLITRPDESITRQCPACLSWVPRGASACSRCGRDLPPVTAVAQKNGAERMVLAVVWTLLGLIAVGAVIFIAVQ